MAWRCNIMHLRPPVFTHINLIDPEGQKPKYLKRMEPSAYLEPTKLDPICLELKNSNPEP